MDFFDVIPTKRKTGYCCVKFCRHKARKGRSNNGCFCRRCRDRRYAQSRPISYTWDKLRYNAKRRQITFELTMEEFVDFCAETNYIERKGREKESLTIDRRDAARGYRLDNIQVLSQSDNGRKSHVDRKLMEYASSGQLLDEEPF